MNGIPVHAPPSSIPFASGPLTNAPDTLREIKLSVRAVLYS